MSVRMDSRSSDFENRFRALIAVKRNGDEDVDEVVAGILNRVRAGGDAALYELTEQFDGIDLSERGLRISAAEIDAAVARVDEETLDALRFAHQRITAHHEQLKPADLRYSDPIGVELGHRWTAIQSVGLYVPGGRASYPSSVLMNAVPARVAGVARLAIVVPTPGGAINPAVMAAAQLAGVDEIYRIGGAQAIGALAFGTESIESVDKIVGPGNAYVASAKRQVFGVVGIDTVAGPSEVLIVADDENNPDWIAVDLLAQAEHDPTAQSILITTSERLADAVDAAVERQLGSLPRAQIAAQSWAKYGATIVVQDLAEAPPLVDQIAPEHLELAVADPEALFAKINNAGAVFLGHHTPEAIGDYVGGSNHVLPTGRSARFASGLSTLDFMKRTSILRTGPDQLRQLGPAAIKLARAEGLDAHARSVTIRSN